MKCPVRDYVSASRVQRVMRLSKDEVIRKNLDLEEGM
jgi:hypothetical protein